jgi:hypothetical protein
VAACESVHIAQAAVIEYLADLVRMTPEVAAVDAHGLNADSTLS